MSSGCDVNARTGSAGYGSEASGWQRRVTAVIYGLAGVTEGNAGLRGVTGFSVDGQAWREPGPPELAGAALLGR